MVRRYRVYCGRQTTHPCKLGPTLCPPPASVVWHCAQRVLNREAPLDASPIYNVSAKTILCEEVIKRGPMGRMTRHSSCNDAPQNYTESRITATGEHTFFESHLLVYSVIPRTEIIYARKQKTFANKKFCLDERRPGPGPKILRGTRFIHRQLPASRFLLAMVIVPILPVPGWAGH